MNYDNVDETTDDTTRRSLFECRVQVANIDMGLNDTCYYYTTDITSTQLWYLGGFHPWLAMLIECPDHKLTPKSCAEAGVGGKGSPQAFGSAGRYPHTCHQATGMIGEKTRPRLLHVRYKRIQMYGSISTGKLPSHQRDPMEGDCLTKHSASWACKGGGASNPSGLGQTGG